MLFAENNLPTKKALTKKESYSITKHTCTKSVDFYLILL